MLQLKKLPVNLSPPMTSATTATATAMNHEKNMTRLASILGTWTGQTHLKTDIGSNELLAYFVVHFMPDPMRGYGCSLENIGCQEEQNKVCEIVGTSSPGADSQGQVCNDIPGNVVDWSDVNAFIYFGAKIDAGFPFNKHRAEDTGGWVGPLNIIMAKGDIDNSKSKSTDGMEVVDRYISRYVKSPLTPYLRMPKNCTLLGADDFDKVAGATAVDSTTKGQYDPERNYDDDDDYDPYHKQYQTCDNGDVQPLLPLFEFDFEQNTTSLEEFIQVKVNYKFLSMPHKSDYMYNLFPWVQRQFNKADLGFHISGPYCYGDDPKRGYTFDMNFDTRDPKAMLKLDHSCIEGLPCMPTAVEYNTYGGNGGGDGGGSGGGGDNIRPGPNIIPEDDGTTVGIGSALVLWLLVAFFSMLLVWTCLMNCRLRRKLKGVLDINTSDSSGLSYDEHDDDNDDIFEDHGDGVTSSTPLLDQNNNEPDDEGTDANTNNQEEEEIVVAPTESPSPSNDDNQEEEGEESRIV